MWSKQIRNASQIVEKKPEHNSKVIVWLVLLDCKFHLTQVCPKLTLVVAHPAFLFLLCYLVQAVLWSIPEVENSSAAFHSSYERG